MNPSPKDNRMPRHAAGALAQNASLNPPADLAYSSLLVQCFRQGRSLLASFVFVLVWLLALGSTQLQAAPTVTTYASGVGSPWALAFDASGNLYVTGNGSNAIYKVAPGGVKSLFVANTQGSGLAFDTNGDLFVSDSSTGQIAKVTPGGVVSPFVTSGAAISEPIAMAFGPDGNLYVADFDASEIFKVTPAGVVSSFAGPADGIVNPMGLVFDGSGNLYVSNWINSTISKVTPGGVASTFIDNTSGLSGARGLAFDGSGNLYVVSVVNSTIFKVTPAGVVSAFLTGSGLDNPFGLASDSSGNIYVANLSGHNVLKLSPIQPQSISFAQVADRRTTDGSFPVSATASSGLPVTLSLLSGPAMLDGTTLTLTGAPGVVVLQANQSGDSSYAAATPVTISFNVYWSGPKTYSGTVDGGSQLAAYMQADDKQGMLIGYLPNQSEGFVVPMILDRFGWFTVTTQGVRHDGTAGGTLTITGKVMDGRLSGTIAEHGLTLAGALNPSSGPALGSAGFYQGLVLNSASGTVYSVLSPSGKISSLVLAPNLAAFGDGYVDTANVFKTTSPQADVVTGQIDPSTTSIVGKVVSGSKEVLSYSGLAATTTRTDRLFNLSARSYVGTNQDVLVTGFVITGASPKPVLLRAVGPALAAYGVNGALAKPVLTVYDQAGQVVLTNQGWADDAALKACFERLGAFAFAAGSADAAVLTTLAPGTYTMHVSGAGGTKGVALAEVYDASVNPQAQYQRMVNISSRGLIPSGDGALIDGFIVTGNSPKKVLIRGVGPTLNSSYGVTGTLSDPVLSVYDDKGALVARNDNWGTPVAVSSTQVTASGVEIATTALSIGAFPLASGSQDAAVVVTLAPGAYTALVSGVQGASGTVLVEVYEIAP